jgi:general secretion pathway protein D
VIRSILVNHRRGTAFWSVRESSLWSPSSRSAWAILLLMSVVLDGCVTGETPPPHAQVVDQIRRVDLTPRFPRSVGPVETVQTTGSSSTAEARTYHGEPSVAEAPRPAAPSRNAEPDADPATTGALDDRAQTDSGNSGFEMNFENTPVATVAKAILGDILAVGYTIDPRVQGTVSLSSGRAVPRKDLLYVLESALRAINVALVRDGRAYRLIPAADAVGTGSLDNRQGPEAGYGISVIPLQFVSGQTLIKLLENFAAKPGMVRAEPSRNLLIIQGNGADRRTAIETVLSFDADWMRGQSVGIYPVTNSTPDPIISELERIIDSGEGGLAQNVIKLQAIARQNSILVVTRKPEFLNRVSTWIKRLDRSGSAGTGVKVYRMRYGEARQVAPLLNDIFIGGSTGGLDSPTNQLIPGGGLVASSSGAPQAATTPGSTAPAAFNTRFADAAGGRAPGAASASATNVRSPSQSGGATVQGATGSILQNVRIAADTVNNTLLIYANQEQYRIIERTLQQIDRPQLQVAIDATIAEVTLNDTLTYGVQFFLKSKNVGLKPDQGSVINTLATAASTAAISRVLPGFNFLVGTEADPRVILDALHSITDVKILSTPSLVVIDNQFASLQVGDQIPITTQTAVSVAVPAAPVVNNIDYRNTGVILRVAPRVNANGNVLLDIEQEISALSTTASTGTLTPTVSQRKVRSSIAIASGQTVLLAGLVSERQERDRDGIPGLDQIPVIGPIFSTYNSKKMQRTELIIFIRPQIIRNGVDAYRVAAELRASLQNFGPPRAAAGILKPYP